MKTAKIFLATMAVFFFFNLYAGNPEKDTRKIQALLRKAILADQKNPMDSLFLDYIGDSIRKVELVLGGETLGIELNQVGTSRLLVKSSGFNYLLMVDVSGTSCIEYNKNMIPGFKKITIGELENMTGLSFCNKSDETPVWISKTYNPEKVKLVIDILSGWLQPYNKWGHKWIANEEF